MTDSERVWMTQKAYVGLQMELAALRSQPTVEVPDDLMECDDLLVAGQRARQARIHQIHQLLMNADVGENPRDDGIDEPGMVLTFRFDDTGEIETFLIGLRGAEEADIEVYSPRSPLGAATLLEAVPYHARTLTYA